METKTYFFKPDNKFLKQGFILLDDNKEVVYEAKMTKFAIFSAFTFEFTNNITKQSQTHKVGHTLTQEQSGGLLDIFSTKSSFKFDGKKIWDYLHEIGIRIDSHLSKDSIGMTYKVSLKGKEIATISTSNPAGKKFLLTSKFCYDITTTEEHLDLAFLSAFAFARTDQATYD